MQGAHELATVGGIADRGTTIVATTPRGVFLVNVSRAASPYIAEAGTDVRESGSPPDDRETAAGIRQRTCNSPALHAVTLWPPG
jgi:hypothetical protein